MADNRAAAVLAQFADLSSRANYVIDKITNLTEPLRFGDTVYVPSVADPTVHTDGATHNPEAAIDSALTLSATLEAFVNVKIPSIDDIQIANGGLAVAVARTGFTGIRNSQDNVLCRDYLARTLCWDGSATYHGNVAGAALTSGLIAKEIAKLAALGGVQRSNIAGFFHPMAIAEIQAFKQNEFTPAGRSESALGMLGVPLVGWVHGIPIYETTSVLTDHTVATTGAVTTGTGTVHTYTIAAGHGLPPGLKVTVSGVDADELVSTATALASVTATTAVINTSATADGTASDGAGTITDATCWNLIMDTTQIFAAKQALPRPEFVKLIDDPGWTLQLWGLWGRIARAGRCRVLHSSSAGPS